MRPERVSVVPAVTLQPGGLSIADLPIPVAAQVAELLKVGMIARITAERASRGRPGVAAFHSLPINALVEQILAVLADVDLERWRSPFSTESTEVPLTEWARAVGVSPATARRYASNGRLPGARKIAGRWSVPRGTPLPQQ